MRRPRSIARGSGGSPAPKSLKPGMTLYKATAAGGTGPTCMDLFSGAGGLAEGFRQAGWRMVAANDADAHAGATFRKNFPEAAFFEGPISKLEPEDLLREAGLKPGELDCLIGGPPCQSFSYNNHERTASDTRARLFRAYLRIVEALEPKTLVMENVPGMLTIGGGAIVTEIETALARLGYKTTIRILYAEDFGVPQQRRRVFVLASRVGDPKDLLPTGTHGPCLKPSEEANAYVHRWERPKGKRLANPITVGAAIADLPILRSGGGVFKSRYKKPAKTAFQRAARRGTRTLYNHVCHRLTESMLDRIAAVPEGGNWRDIPFELLTAGMQRARPSDHTKRYGRLKRNALASTILTKCDPHWGAYVHPTQNRTITVREAARLQGFPDKFIFAGDHLSKQYEQVGNAVPPPLASAIARMVRAQVESKVESRPETSK